MSSVASRDVFLDAIDVGRGDLDLLLGDVGARDVPDLVVVLVVGVELVDDRGRHLDVLVFDPALLDEGDERRHVRGELFVGVRHLRRLRLDRRAPHDEVGADPPARRARDRHALLGVVDAEGGYGGVPEERRARDDGGADDGHRDGACPGIREISVHLGGGREPSSARSRRRG